MTWHYAPTCIGGEIEMIRACVSVILAKPEGDTASSASISLPLKNQSKVKEAASGDTLRGNVSIDMSAQNSVFADRPATLSIARSIDAESMTQN